MGMFLLIYATSVLLLHCLSYFLCLHEKKRGEICIVDVSVFMSDPSMKLFDNKDILSGGDHKASKRLPHQTHSFLSIRAFHFSL